LALEAVQLALVKAPAEPKKTRQRTAQLKLAGIATIQSEQADTDKRSNRSSKSTEPKAQDELPLDSAEAHAEAVGQSKSA
jgi:ribonuclease-3